MFQVAARTLLGVALTLCVASHAGAMTDWDQAKVTEIAKQLEDSVEGLRDAMRNSPEWTYPARRPILYRIRDNLRWIENEATHLHAMLAKGEGMEATLNSYKRIQQLKRETEDLAKHTETTAFTQPALDKARGTLEQLGSYYLPEAAQP